MNTRPTRDEIDRYLDEDIFTASSYKYIALSFCTSKTRQKLDRDDGRMALKLRGAFRSIDDGIAHIKDLQRTKDPFDTYLCEMGKWTLLGNIQGVEDHERCLVEIMRGLHCKNADLKKEFNERKERAMKDGINEDDYELTKDPEAPGTDSAESGGAAQTLDSIQPMRCDESSSVDDESSKHTSFSAVDAIKVPDVHVGIVSFVEPDPAYIREDIQIPEGCVAVKFRGAFDTKKEAEEFMESTLSKIEKDVDMYVVDMYKWLLVPPHIDDVQEVKYREEYLQDMFTGRAESQKAARMHALEREKEEANIQQSIMESVSNHPVENGSTDPSASSSKAT